MTDVIWKSVIGYEGSYEVSNQGDVRSLSRTVAGKGGRSRTYPGKTLVGGISNGYRFVTLSRNNKFKNVMVHRLVAAAFIGKCPYKNDVCHKNGDKKDNRVQNLEYGTRSKNNLDGYRIRGYVFTGQKINPDIAKDIYHKVISGAVQKDIACQYGVSPSAISAIKVGKMYAHATMERMNRG